MIAGRWQGVVTMESGSVTVVSGLPRSGTSMMMRMLQAGGMPLLVDEARAADEDNLDGYFEFDAVKRLERDSSWMHQAVGRAVKVIAMLLPHLPPDFRYRVLLLERRLPEVLASQREMLRRQGREVSATEDERLARIYEDRLRSIRQWLAGQANIEVLDLNYNEILADAGPAIERICEFLQAPLDRPAMRAVVSPARYRQRSQPGEGHST